MKIVWRTMSHGSLSIPKKEPLDPGCRRTNDPKTRRGIIQNPPHQLQPELNPNLESGAEERRSREAARGKPELGAKRRESKARGGEGGVEEHWNMDGWGEGDPGMARNGRRGLWHLIGIVIIACD